EYSVPRCCGAPVDADAPEDAFSLLEAVRKSRVDECLAVGEVPIQSHAAYAGFGSDVGDRGIRGLAQSDRRGGKNLRPAALCVGTLLDRRCALVARSCCGRACGVRHCPPLTRTGMYALRYPLEPVPVCARSGS